MQIEDFDFSGRQEGNVSDATVGPDQNFAERGRGIESLGQLAGVQVDCEDVPLQAGGDQPTALGCGLGTVRRLRQVDPRGDFVGRGIDHRDSRRFLVVSKNVLAIRLYGDALNLLGDGNCSDQGVMSQVENADGAGVSVGGVGATSIGGDYEHVGFRLAGRILRHDFTGDRIDNVERLGKLGGYVEAAVGANARLVGAQWFSEVDGEGEFTFTDVDDIDGAAVGAGLADAGIAVNRNVSIVAIFADGDFVAIYAHRDLGDFAAGFRIDQQGGVLDLIGDDQKAVRGRVRADQRRCKQKHK